MSENIIIIGASGAIGSSFINYYINQNPSNIIYSLSRKEIKYSNDNIKNILIDIEDEQTIVSAAGICSEHGSFDKIIVATGILHDENLSPEKSFRHLEKNKLEKVFSVNTFGPAMIARYFIPLLNKEKTSFFGVLSARVGSISDNKIGGWYSYRASKAALNMIIKSLSIEVARNNPNAIIVGLHPGTVDSNLSNPFQKNVSDGKLFTPDYSIAKMTNVINSLTTRDTGNCFAWDGERIEF